MAGLYHTLGIGAESLYTSRQGVDTSGHNIANAHTEGYSRQRVNAVTRIPSDSRGYVIGNGVFVKSIARAHDRFLEKQINDNNQDHGAAAQMYDELATLEVVFSPEAEASVADEVGNFFDSLQMLANFPEELPVRTNVVESAQNLATAFKRIDSKLKTAQVDLNDKISGMTDRLTNINQRIAQLNVAINSMETSEEVQANDLRDQQEKLIRELSEHVDVNYYRSNGGMVTVRGPGESLLVDMNKYSKFASIAREGDPTKTDIVVTDDRGRHARVITKSVSKGKLKSIIDVRDKVITNLIGRNNEMAGALVREVNAVHRNGYGLGDFSETTGRNFFETSLDPNLAAQNIKIADVILENADSISAAATPNAPGDNVMVNEMLRLKDKKTLEGGRASFNEYYSNYVGVLGLEVVRSEHLKQASDIIKSELDSRREAVAGVSMDEEAMNLLKWQANFTASSKVVTTVDEMLETVLSMKR